MVIRDLTLRSAASFGSFHLIRLLYDEYMFYLVEHKVAAATGETSIAVMGEFRQVTLKVYIMYLVLLYTLGQTRHLCHDVVNSDCLGVTIFMHFRMLCSYQPLDSRSLFKFVVDFFFAMLLMPVLR
jgi:hypothetical protein